MFVFLTICLFAVTATALISYTTKAKAKRRQLEERMNTLIRK
ncbi:hypothetical protein OAP63_11975 [Vibrio sp.]|nr:hypothetical protein [Vibrio viridaestus]MDC0611449.1 hypothetical protein [Vibrio sp.]